MKHSFHLLAVALLACAALPHTANAAVVLDTGTPTGSSFPLSLDGTDFVAAEFSLGAGQTITSIQGYVTSGLSNPGDTFTLALYEGSGNVPPDSHATALWSGQATYQADGWNGLNGLSVSGLSAGNYWVALEVGVLDSASALAVPVGAPNAGSAAALAFAFNSGDGYQTMTGENFGVQVSAVPLPGAVVLLGSGLLGLAGMRRRRAAA